MVLWIDMNDAKNKTLFTPKMCLFKEFLAVDFVQIEI